MHCDTYHCELSEAACAKRYRMANGIGGRIGGVANHLVGDLGCSECRTGRRMAAEPAAAKNTQKTSRRKSKMSEDQTKFKKTVAAGQRQCRICGEVKDLGSDFNKAKHGYDRVCQTCKAEQPAKRTPRGASVEDHDAADDPQLLTLDFSACPQLLTRIEAIAAQELRSPANQVLYWLVGYVRDRA